MAHVVILEARDASQLTESTYHQLLETLESAGISSSRVMVQHVQELPVAFRMVIEATKGGGSPGKGGWRRPDGYIFIGNFFRQLMPSHDILYREIFRSLQDLACYYTLPVSYAFSFGDAPFTQTDAYAALGDEAARVCMSLMNLKHQLGLSPSSLFTP